MEVPSTSSDPSGPDVPPASTESISVTAQSPSSASHPAQTPTPTSQHDTMSPTDATDPTEEDLHRMVAHRPTLDDSEDENDEVEHDSGLAYKKEHESEDEELSFSLAAQNIHDKPAAELDLAFAAGTGGLTLDEELARLDNNGGAGNGSEHGDAGQEYEYGGAGGTSAHGDARDAFEHGNVGPGHGQDEMDTKSVASDTGDGSEHGDTGHGRGQDDSVNKGIAPDAGASPSLSRSTHVTEHNAPETSSSAWGRLAQLWTAFASDWRNLGIFILVLVTLITAANSYRRCGNPRSPPTAVLQQGSILSTSLGADHPILPVHAFPDSPEAGLTALRYIATMLPSTHISSSLRSTLLTGVATTEVAYRQAVARGPHHTAGSSSIHTPGRTTETMTKSDPMASPSDQTSIYPIPPDLMVLSSASSCTLDRHICTARDLYISRDVMLREVHSLTPMVSSVEVSGWIRVWNELVRTTVTSLLTRKMARGDYEDFLTEQQRY